MALFTCDHSHEALKRDGVLLPIRAWNSTAAIQLLAIGHGWLATVIWLTDLAVPDAAALGLPSDNLPCDRTLHRWRMAEWHGALSGVVELPVQWPYWFASHAGTVPRADKENLETAPGAQPEHWWVSTEPVPVIYDPIGT